MIYSIDEAKRRLRDLELLVNALERLLADYRLQRSPTAATLEIVRRIKGRLGMT